MSALGYASVACRLGRRGSSVVSEHVATGHWDDPYVPATGENAPIGASATRGYHRGPANQAGQTPNGGLKREKPDRASFAVMHHERARTPARGRSPLGARRA
jgi:hypothetical protein